MGKARSSSDRARPPRFRPQSTKASVMPLIAVAPAHACRAWRNMPPSSSRSNGRAGPGAVSTKISGHMSRMSKTVGTPRRCPNRTDSRHNPIVGSAATMTCGASASAPAKAGKLPGYRPVVAQTRQRDVRAVAAAVQQADLQPRVDLDRRVLLETVLLPHVVEGRGPPGHLVAVVGQEGGEISAAVQPVIDALAHGHRLADHDQPNLHSSLAPAARICVAS